MRSRYNLITLYSLLFLCLIALLTLPVLAQNKRATASSPVPISLNGDTVGDISDTTRLVTKLREVFKKREINGVFRPKSNEIEKAVFLDARRGVSIIDFGRIFAAANAAGATPIQMPIVKTSRVDFNPNPLALVVFAGTANDADRFAPQDGIDISFIGELEQGGSVGTGRVLIDVDKDGNYSIGGKAVPASMLAARLRPLKPADRTIFADVTKAADLAPLKYLATAAANAGCEKVYFITQNTAFTKADLSFSLSPAWYKTNPRDAGSDQIVSFSGPDDAHIEFDTTYLTDDFLRKASVPGSPMSGGSASSLTNDDLSNEIDFELATHFRSTDTSFSRVVIGGVPGLLSQDITVESESGSISWQGYRMKDGKLQLIRIHAYCSNTEYAHRQSEFTAILHSVKFK